MRAVESGEVTSVELLTVFGTTSIHEIFSALNLVRRGDPRPEPGILLAQRSLSDRAYLHRLCDHAVVRP